VQRGGWCRHVGHPDQAGQRCARRLRLVEQVQHDPDRVEQPQEVQRGGGGGADGDGVGAHQQEAGDEDGEHADELRPVHGQPELALGVRRGERGVDGHPRAAVDARELGAAAPEGAHGGGAAHPGQQGLGALALGQPLRGVEPPRRARVPTGDQHPDRQRREPGEREAPVEHGEPDQGEADVEQGDHDGGDRPAHALGDHRDVAADALQQVAGARPFDVGERHVERAADHAFAQRGEHLLTEPGHQHRAERGEHRARQERGEDGEREPVDEARRAAVDHRVDDPAEQRRHHEHRDRGQHQGGRGGGEQRAVRRHQLAEGAAGAGEGRHGQHGHASTACR
jgi:hypothetical protein